MSIVKSKIKRSHLNYLQKPDKLTTLDRLKLTTLLPTQIDHPFFSKKASIKSQWFLVKNSVS